MRVFVTGGHRFHRVGPSSGSCPEQVTKSWGLARSGQAAATLTAAGAEAHRGRLDDLASLRNGASRAGRPSISWAGSPSSPG
jgi:hypothetical protein